MVTRLSYPHSTSDVSRETREAIQKFIELLARWNPTVRLLSPFDLDHLWQRHIVDSLQLLPFVREATTPLDVGSGAGFPGLILALAGSLAFTLAEVDHRKAAFLQEAIRVTRAPAKIVCAPVETLSAQYDCITARAVAPLSRLLGLVHGRLEPGGLCVLPKGRGWSAELTEAKLSWDFNLEMHPSVTDAFGRILLIRDIHPKRRS